MNNLNPKLIDPFYVQISKKQAAEILGFSVTELDRRRSNDPACPKGFQDKGAGNHPIRFRLSDIYTYSEHLMNQAQEATIGSPESPDTTAPNYQPPKDHKV